MVYARYALVLVVALELAVGESFLVAARPFGMALPVSAVLAVVGNVTLGLLGARVLGRPVRFVQQPLDELGRTNAELAAMFRWFDERGYQADIAALRALYPELTSFRTWLRATGWDRLASTAR